VLVSDDSSIVPLTRCVYLDEDDEEDWSQGYFALPHDVDVKSASPNSCLVQCADCLITGRRRT